MSMPETGIDGATQWLQGLLSGNVILRLATLGILAFGFAMLSGRLSMRRGAATAVGCFVLIGAGSIARTFIDHPSTQGHNPPVANQVDNAPIPSKVVRKNDDPYAGSSLVPN